MIFLIAAIATAALVAYVAWRDRDTSPLKMPEAGVVAVCTFFCLVGVMVTLLAMWRVIAESL